MTILILIYQNNLNKLSLFKNNYSKYLSIIKNYSTKDDQTNDDKIRKKIEELRKRNEPIKTSQFVHPNELNKNVNLKNQFNSFNKKEVDKKESTDKSIKDKFKINDKSTNKSTIESTDKSTIESSTKSTNKLKNNSIFKVSIFHREYLKELFSPKGNSESYYFKKYEIDQNTNINVYHSNLPRNYELFCAALILIFPIFVYVLYRFNEKAKDGETFVPIDFEEGQFNDDDDEEDIKMNLLSFIGVMSVFLIQISILIHHLRTTPSAIYFNRNNKKFIIIFKQLPILNKIKKEIINCGQAKKHESNTLLISKVFKTNTKLLKNNKLIYLDDNLFIKPLYGNLFYGYTKEGYLDK